jgi:bifunctional non-homologous end joining protein LigD
VDAAGAVWAEPLVAVEVRHLGRGESGRLRQPVLLGVRTDVDPAVVRLE